MVGLVSLEPQFIGYIEMCKKLPFAQMKTNTNFLIECDGQYYPSLGLSNAKDSHPL